MSNTVRQIALKIVGREGGFVDDPDDPGGATKHGVTIHTLRRLGLDLDHDGDVDTADVKLLTVENATDIFINHYFFEPKINQLPEALHSTVFDMQVNAGNTAVKLLQRLVNRIDDTLSSISEDGAIGPNTLRKVTAAANKIGQEALKNAYGIERRNYYFSLADRRPSARKYCRTRAGGKGGWIHRAEEFIDTRYHMSTAEFNKRVASWV